MSPAVRVVIRPTETRWRHLPGVVATVVVLVTLVGCSTPTKGATVDTKLTQTAAQTRMVELLAGSLAGFPATASLDVRNPRAPQNPFPPSQSAPCDDNDNTSSGPVNVALYRWVVDGTPPRPIGDVATVAASWSAAGWSVESRSDGSAVTTTPDGYTLDASDQQSGRPQHRCRVAVRGEGEHRGASRTRGHPAPGQLNAARAGWAVSAGSGGAPRWRGRSGGRRAQRGGRGLAVGGQRAGQVEAVGRGR